jgi:HD-GYP domain-containing protein (c-di-GMP phosphodiesterase class II)
MMGEGAPRAIIAFAPVRAWLLAQDGVLGRVRLDDAASVSIHRPRARVTVVDASARGSIALDELDVIVVVGQGAVLEATLSSFPNRRLQLLALPCSPQLVEHTVTEALRMAEAYAQARVADQLLEIGNALNAARDPGRVLELILSHAQQITNADAASIYVVNDNKSTLTFKFARNHSVNADFSEFTMRISDRSIVGAAALSAKTVRIDDLYVPGGPVVLGRPFTHDRSFDERFGYQTRSMITTPMISPEGKVLAIIQLINARIDRGPLQTPEDFETRVCPFTEQDEHLCEALASQGAVALESARLHAEVQALFEGFVRASVHAIEQRDPSTRGHSQRVADLTVELAKAADRTSVGMFRDVSFDREALREIQYAGLLHDFGKVGVREEVLVKAKKLHDHQLQLVLSRFDHMRTVLQLELLEEQLERAKKGQRADDEELLKRHAQRLHELEDMVRLVAEANEPSVLPADASERLAELGRFAFRGPRGDSIQIVGADEVGALSIRRGSLTEAERAQIQAHVTHTYNFLSRIPWGPSLARVPEIAAKHHEYLDGSGYPDRAPAPQIPLQARMMTIADIFDALTASDRPYKKAVPVTKALDILNSEVQGGKLDPEVFDLFIRARVYEVLVRPLQGRMTVPPISMDTHIIAHRDEVES